MYCEKCGEELGDDEKFCHVCGNKIDNENLSDCECGSNFFEEVINEKNQKGEHLSYKLIDSNRSALAYFVLSIITCGLYSLYFMHRLGSDMNIVCEGDGDKTTCGLELILLSLITCGLYNIYWIYKIANRIHFNSSKYLIRVDETGTTVLLWYIIGAFLCGVGPFVAMYFIIENANRLFSAYNNEIRMRN